MSQPIRVLLVTIYPLWAEVCRHALVSLPRRIDVTVSITLNSGIAADLALCSDVVLVSLDLPIEGLDLVRSLHAAGYEGGVMLICSHYAVPSFDELAEARVHAIISSLASLHDLASSIYALADRHPDLLLDQHLRATQAPTQKPVDQTALNGREREILQLVARDLTDREIATHLHLSVRTVSNQLHRIYSKLGVKGRTGAVIAAVTRGLMRLPPCTTLILDGK